jgi:hypothetical protein
MKWAGASTWVPECTLQSIRESLLASPADMALIRSRTIFGSPGQTGKSGLTGREMSWISMG